MAAGGEWRQQGASFLPAVQGVPGTGLLCSTPKNGVFPRENYTLRKLVINVMVWIYNEKKIEADMVFIFDSIASEVEK